MKLKRYKHFKFGKLDKARIHLRRTFSNLFLTLTDLNHKVIICKTSGSLE